MRIRGAETVTNIRPYFFSSLNITIEALKARGVEVIRLDMGSPDLPPAKFIVDKLIESAQNPKKHGYTPMGGAPDFLKAVATYYKKRFDVELNVANDIVALIGSKEGIFNINHTLLDPDDLVLLPDPFYPVYLAGAQIANCRISFMPLLRENNFLPDFNAIPKDVAKEARLMWLNYPNNPTGAIADLDFFKKAVAFALENEIIIAHDAPYMDVTYDGFKACSILEVDGAREVAIEFNSLSKTYNMAGWRVGMACGNAEIVRLLKVYKSQIDSSIFAPILDAAILALTDDQTWIMERNKIYQERRDIVCDALEKSGFIFLRPKAALYVWAKLPEGYSDSMDFCSKLLDETGVSITPGVVYGPSGEGFVRVSIITPTQEIQKAMDKVITWLDDNRKKF